MMLSEYVGHFQARWGVTAKLIVEDADALALSPLVEVQLLRVIQEALANVRKHAQARHVWITFKTEDKGVAVIVEDDGKGFEPDDAQLGHFGLRLMRERCESVGGSLHVDSAIGQGTRIEARLPLNISLGREEKVDNEAHQRVGRG
jgi:signal transduction histidine kinase